MKNVYFTNDGMFNDLNHNYFENGDPLFRYISSNKQITTFPLPNPDKYGFCDNFATVHFNEKVSSRSCT